MSASVSQAVLNNLRVRPVEYSNGTNGRMGGRYELSPTARHGIDTSTNLGVMAHLPSEDGASTWLTIL